jgi:hypothetical protein
MYRKLAALVLAAALLCSCSARVTVQRYPAELPQVESPAATPTPEPVPTFTEEQKSYGSAALLTDATVLVNVFLNDAAHGHTWDAESRAAAVQRTQLAVDWITEQAAGYEAAVNLICDRSADGSDSTLTRSYLVQSAMQGGENSEESSAFLDEMDTLCASLAADSRLAAYGARHIAFLFFLPISGTSFTMAHYADDGDSFYYEYSCLYKTDAYTDGEAESPATYAHEILHLFGAPDLYEGSSDPYVDEALVSYVADTYPGDIMLSTYEDDGSSRFDAITKEISPLTAYCLGLTDTCPELAQFPLLADMTAAAERFLLAAFLSARSRAFALPRSQRSTLISACRFASCIRISGSSSVKVRYHFEWKNRSSFFLLDRCFHSSGSCTSLNSAFR